MAILVYIRNVENFNPMHLPRCACTLRCLHQDCEFPPAAPAGGWGIADLTRFYLLWRFSTSHIDIDSIVPMAYEDFAGFVQIHYGKIDFYMSGFCFFLGIHMYRKRIVCLKKIVYSYKNRFTRIEICMAGYMGEFCHLLFLITLPKIRRQDLKMGYIDASRRQLQYALKNRV